MNLLISEIIKATKAMNHRFDESLAIHHVSTDSRTLKKGDLYIALKGERFDGNRFVAEALSKGAVGAIVSNEVSKVTGNYLVVNDTQKALGDMARAWRQKLSLPVLAITGSAGKTTTKELVAALLGRKGRVGKTEGNLNNLIGVPLTLFQLDETQKFAVVEMGMNAFEEIRRLTQIACPNVGLITNVARAHLEGVGSIEGVAKAKGEMFEELASESIALVNNDDPFIRAMPTKANRVTYGFEASSDILASQLKMASDHMTLQINVGSRCEKFRLPFVGDYLARNFLAAYAVLHVLNVATDEIEESLQGLEFFKHRGQSKELSGGITLIDDCYNANPEAMQAAFMAMKARFPDRRTICVLGDMFELGINAASLHEEVGVMARTAGMNQLKVIGQYGENYAKGFGAKAYVYTEMEILLSDLKQELKEGDVVLVKGSRGARMERVLEGLEA